LKQLEKQILCRRLAQRFDALGAQRLLDQAALLHDGNLLQVRFELAVGRIEGERTIMTESGCLAAGIALSHLMDPFRTMIPIACPNASLRVQRIAGPIPSYQGQRILP